MELKLYKLIIKRHGKWKVAKWFRNKEDAEDAVQCHPEITKYEEVDILDFLVENFNSRANEEFWDD